MCIIKILFKYKLLYSINSRVEECNSVLMDLRSIFSIANILTH